MPAISTVGKYANSSAQYADVAIVVLPHLGIVDSWLPVLSVLRQKFQPLSICAVAPDVGQLSRARTDDFLLSSCDAILDGVASRRFGEGWTHYSNFNDAVEHARDHKERAYGRIIESFQCRFPTLAAIVDQKTPRAKIALSDFLLGNRPMMRALRKTLQGATWFSLPHGIDPRLSKIGEGKHMGTSVRIPMTVYAASAAEARLYEEAYSLRSSDIKVVGIPRHNRRWIDTLTHHYAAESGDRDFIFLASRPVSEKSFTEPKKRQAVHDVKKLAARLGCKILVRLHPLEGDEDRSIFDSVLGREPYGEVWSYTTKPALVAGRGALFAITFFSSVAVDMLAIDVPVIELCDFSDLTKSQNLVRDHHGHLTSVYQQTGLVCGAANYPQLEAHALQILADRNGVLEELKSAYEKVYANPEQGVDVIANDILEALVGSEVSKR